MSIIIVVWLLCGITSAFIANAKGRSGFGWFLIGCIGGVFALIAIAAVPARSAGPRRWHWF